MRQLTFFIIAIIAIISFSAPAQNETSVLFIGNSLTFSNNMPKMVERIAVANGKKVFVDTIVKRGMNLEYHATQKRTYKKIKSRKWSYIVVQGRSTEFAKSDKSVDSLTLPYLQQIVDSIRHYSTCTRIVLYETWGYKYGKPEIVGAKDYLTMQSQIKRQTKRVAEILGIGVCPVGEAWSSIYQSDTTIAIYKKDHYHPTPTGSYIAACTFYVALFGETAYGNKAKFGITETDRKTIELQTAGLLVGNRNKWKLQTPVKYPVTGFDLVLQNNDLKLVDRSSHTTTVTWYFGDGHSSKLTNPSHKYTNKGVYTVRQVATGKCGTSTLKRTITIKNMN